MAAGGGLGFAPDIPDRGERDKWVKNETRRLFFKQGGLIRTIILRTTTTPPQLAILAMDLPYEMAQHGGEIGRHFAKALQAQQLYLAMEIWYSQVTPEEAARANREGPKVAPRHDPNRKEALLIVSEDPFTNPPLRSWRAEITRDAKGQPSVGEWLGDLNVAEGRLTYLLPPEAYIAAGKKVPQS